MRNKASGDAGVKREGGEKKTDRNEDPHTRPAVRLQFIVYIYIYIYTYIYIYIYIYIYRKRD